ncbi:hypothetical protein [Roseinatronobacter sp. S2]|uniref:hypothetical protein n=1 Tax=Roseinatronobacter sp. S2 TaxID=3035471 RepID=UPI00240FFD06|nr:hypothetical protein [Roseinatronobacter sp. S2]WFE77041.1 hypothetical protein P8S53_20115 [Roseinatronobacter sp. S2]
MKFIGIVTLLAAGSVCGMAQAECADIVLRMHITKADHFNSAGTRITDAAGILQQNLYHVNSAHQIDALDATDPYFQSRTARTAFAKAARSHLSQTQSARIQDITRENVITIGVNGCIDFDTRLADYRISHITFSDITDQGYTAPFMPAADDASMWSAQNPELLGTHFHKTISARDFRIAYLVNPEAKLMMLDTEFFCGTLGCSAVLLDAQDNLVWEGEMVEQGVSVMVAADGNIINIYNADNQLSQISMPR